MTAENEQPTIPQMFRERSRRFARKNALMVKRGGAYQGITFEDFARNVERIGNGLLQLGVAPGDRVGLLSENMPQWAFCDLAILSAGAVNVPIYATNSAKEVQYILANSEACVAMVSTAEQLAKVLEVRGTLPALRKIVVVQPAGWASDPQVISLDDLQSAGDTYKSGHPAALVERSAAVAPDDLASIIYTSGTTGPPKGVMLTHGNFLSNVRGSLDGIDVGEGDIALSFLPLCHAFERTAGYYLMIHQGATIAYAENINTVPQNMLEVRPTIVVSVPRLYEKMHARVLDSVASAQAVRRKLFGWAIGVGKRAMVYEIDKRPVPVGLALQKAIARKLVFGKLQARLGGRLRFFVSGGAPLGRDIAEFFRAADIVILEGYGLSETSPVLTANTPGHFRFGTVGRALPFVELRIAADGEILARGPNIMQGYYKNPEATAEALRDGWFHTGDIGEIDADGFLRITDRKKDIIVTSGGKNVAPQNIENLLKADEYIAQVVIHGDRRKFLSALIVPEFEALEKWAHGKGLVWSSREELVRHPEVHAHVEARIAARSGELASYEQIKKFALLPAELTQESGELTPTLKVKRKVVASRHAALFDSFYAEV